MDTIKRLRRLPLMALAALSLLAALWAGLVRLGWPMPSLPIPLAAQHGPLMVSGFIGTLISLERAVALSHRGPRFRWAYLAPLLSGLGAAAYLFGLPPELARGAMTLGALGLVIIFAVIVRLHADAAHVTMGVGAVLWLVGNGWWSAGAPVSHVVPWWAGFLVVTIAGERLELARVLLIGRTARATFLAAIGVILLGLLILPIAFDAGMRVSGAGLLALGLWLLRFDIARRTIRQSGLTRYIAACLLAGHVWLTAGGLLWLVFGGGYGAGPVYDAMLHTVFLGFVMSMIFGHAPVILPAVLGVPVSYHPAFYAHLGLLHLSLVLRIAGDLAPNADLRRWGGMFNEVALLLFLALTAYTVRRHSKAAEAKASAPVHEKPIPTTGAK